eukprot:331264_1
MAKFLADLTREFKEKLWVKIDKNMVLLIEQDDLANFLYCCVSHYIEEKYENVRIPPETDQKFKEETLQPFENWLLKYKVSQQGLTFDEFDRFFPRWLREYYRERDNLKTIEEQGKKLKQQEKVIKSLQETQEEKLQKNLEKIKQALSKRAEVADKYRNDVDTLMDIPLHRFTTNNVSNVVRSWILSDIKHIKTSKHILKVMLEQSLTGEKLISLNQHLDVVLEKAISQYITTSTFFKIIQFLKSQIMKNKDAFAKLNEEEIAGMTVDCMLNLLCETIVTNNITGENVQQNNKLFVSWVEQQTGWGKQQIQQINSILLKYKTLSSQEIQSTIVAEIKNKFDEKISSIIAKTIAQNNVDLAKLQLKIKHMRNIDKEQDVFTNCLQILEQTKQEGYHTTFYQLIAHSLQTKSEWTCFNCSNKNLKLKKYINVCKLCGVTELTSIKYALKDLETYGNILLKKDKKINQNNKPKSEEVIDVDTTLSDNVKLYLHCPNSTKTTVCPSIARLSKQLYVYQSWINRIRAEHDGKNDIEYTTNTDITQLTHESFCKTVTKAINVTEKVTEAAKSKVKQLKMTIAWFATLNRKDVLKMMKDDTNLKISECRRFYEQTKKMLKIQAHTERFGEFFNDVELDELFDDYHHILGVHMANGDKMTKDSVFIHFRDVAKCNDNDCSSLSRNERRQFNLNNNEDGDNYTEENKEEEIDENIWAKEQYYAQSTLDLVHSYFVHHDWKRDSHINEEEQKYSYLKKQKSALQMKIDDNNQKKYVTEHYGFGIDYDYIHLEPIFSCLRDEMLKNKIYSLRVSMFQNLLMKALKKHHIAIDQYGYYCTHYDPDYHIIRNEPIGIGHMLCIIIYTDISKFCTAFRSTYRISNEQDTEKSVTKSHQSLYWFARTLWEAIEFFGQPMSKKMEVFHGLNKVLCFERVTSYFNQPISTTTSKIEAQKFSQGYGLILIFKRGSSSNGGLIPKYLDVSWTSAFPNEDERLFYGKNIVFQIWDVITAQHLVSHREDLKALNLFQKCITNQKIDWTNRKKTPTNTIKHLTELVTNQMQRRKVYLDSIDIDENDNKQNYESKNYGEKLFDFFCTNESLKWIGVRNVHSVPSLLNNVLIHDTNKYFISFNLLSTLIPNCDEIILTDIKSKIFTDQCENYIICVIKYMKYVSANKNIKHKVHKITLESNEEIESKPNPTLRKLSEQYSSLFVQLNWTIKYQFKLETYHSLSFTRNKNVNFTSSQIDTMKEIMDKYNQFENMDMIDEEMIGNEVVNIQEITTNEKANNFIALIEQKTEEEQEQTINFPFTNYDLTK